MSVYLLLYYCVLLTVALAANSFGAITGAIIAGNVSINFAIPFISAALGGREQERADRGLGGDIVTVILVELAGARWRWSRVRPAIAPQRFRVRHDYVHDRSTPCARRRPRVRAPARRRLTRRLLVSPGHASRLWAMVDTSPSTAISVLVFTSHIFRMSLFFFMAGFFARMLLPSEGRARLLVRSRADASWRRCSSGGRCSSPPSRSCGCGASSTMFGSGPPPLPPAGLPPPPPSRFR